MNKINLQHPSITIVGLLTLLGAGIAVANSIDNRVLSNTAGLVLSAAQLLHERESREKAELETQRKLDDLKSDSSEIQRLLNQLLLK